MAWSKVKKGEKPFMWWIYKIVCELAYHSCWSNLSLYYKCLDLMTKQGFNLYGEQVKNHLKVEHLIKVRRLLDEKGLKTPSYDNCDAMAYFLESIKAVSTINSK